MRSPTERVRFGGVQTPHGYLFELTGGRLCLDLVNTLDERATDHPRELLPRYQDLIDWGVQAGAVSRAEAGTLRARVARERGAAEKALARVIALRETLFLIFSAVARGSAVPVGALARLNDAVVEAAARRRVTHQRGGFTWSWEPAEPDDLDRLRWMAAWSAADLLTSAEADRVRQCAGAGCAWLFLDTSKNRTRRWCDMSVCGNRAKARRHYQKLSQ